MKHTSGPWFNETGKLILDKRGFSIAQTWDEAGGKEEAIANAQLISAAPDLLELARAILSYCQDDSRSARRKNEMILAAREIIAKAEGK